MVHSNMQYTHFADVFFIILNLLLVVILIYYGAN